VKVGTHTRLSEKGGTHGETGAFRMGALLLPSERSARSQTSPARVSERQTLPLLGLGRVCSRRRRGPAGLRDPVIRPLMLRFSVSVRNASARFPANATRSSSHLKPSTQPRFCSKNHTQGLTGRNRGLPSLGHSAALCRQRNCSDRRICNPFIPPRFYKVIVQTAYIAKQVRKLFKKLR